MTASRPLRAALHGVDSLSLGAGALVTVLAAYASVQAGTTFVLGPPLALLAFSALVAAFVSAPHVAVACTIPLFAAIPTLKLVVPGAGATKDVVTAAAIVATVVVYARRRGWAGDHWAVALVAPLLGLYVVNLGGGFAAESFDLAWAHGVRLVAEPLLLLLVGFGLPYPRRTRRWAVRSLVLTAVGVAAVGIGQQLVGPARLVALGFDYNKQVRTIGGHMRSFGTLDEPFAYAALLLLGLAVVLFALRRGPFAYAAGAIIGAGLAASLARTAAVVSVALLGLWLARHGFMAVAVLVSAAALIGSAVLFVSAGATESKTVVAGSSTYLTINGRTEAWKLALGEPEEWPFGRGVGEVGTAAQRATLTVSGSRKEADSKPFGAVDSGYFATVADVGLVGLCVLLALLGRLAALARRAAGADRGVGWLAAGLLTVLLIDALTRASFTAFPTAYLGFLLTGLALRTALDRERSHA